MKYSVILACFHNAWKFFGLEVRNCPRNFTLNSRNWRIHLPKWGEASLGFSVPELSSPAVQWLSAAVVRHQLGSVDVGVGDGWQSPPSSDVTASDGVPRLFVDFSLCSREQSSRRGNYYAFHSSMGDMICVGKREMDILLG